MTIPEKRILGQAGAYLEFSVVGAPADARSAALFAASPAVYHPRKLTHFEPPGGYPDRCRPALYICNPDYGSLPIENPRDIPGHLEAFRRPVL